VQHKREGGRWWEERRGFSERGGEATNIISEAAEL
jgi:hypothetical protein